MFREDVLNDIGVLSTRGEVTMDGTQREGMYTRTQMRTLLSMTATELDTLERQAIVSPTVQRSAGDTRPAYYSPVDVAVVAAAVAAGRLGVRGRNLARFTELLATRRKRLTPGWSGWAAWDGEAVELLAEAADVGRVTAGFASPAALLLIPIEVPAGSGP
jgi:hypothetical protein